MVQPPPAPVPAPVQVLGSVTAQSLGRRGGWAVARAQRKQLVPRPAPRRRLAVEQGWCWCWAQSVQRAVRPWCPPAPPAERGGRTKAPPHGSPVAQGCLAPHAPRPHCPPGLLPQQRPWIQRLVWWTEERGCQPASLAQGLDCSQLPLPAGTAGHPSQPAPLPGGVPAYGGCWGLRGAVSVPPLTGGLLGPGRGQAWSGRCRAQPVAAVPPASAQQQCACCRQRSLSPPVQPRLRPLHRPSLVQAQAPRRGVPRGGCFVLTLCWAVLVG